MSPRPSPERRAAQTALGVGAGLAATALVIALLFAAEKAAARWEHTWLNHLPRLPRPTTHSES